MATIRFGTDGWRAIIAEDFTFANVARVAQAAAEAWRDDDGGRSGRVVIGYDRRFLSDQFARVTAEVFLGNGYSVVLADAPTPTPAVSFAVRSLRARGGIMITASHNPPAFNGIKLKATFGGPALPEACARVEAALDRHPVRRDSLEQNRRCRVVDLRSDYLAAVRRFVDLPAISRAGLRLAHDAMFGVGAGCFERLLAGTKCQVTGLNTRHDPYFGGVNPEPIPRNYAASSAYLRRHPHDFCLVTDGDADRIGGMDGRGRPLSTHQIICLLLQHLVEHRGAKGRMVKALSTTSMVDRLCEDRGIELVETAVGFKHITAEILRGGVLLGAEESGGIGFPDLLPERDGIAAGLVLLELLACRRKSVNRLIADLEKRYGPHRYARLDLAYPVEARAALMNYCRNHPPTRLARSPVVGLKTFDGIKCLARDGSWLMLRVSGTEPIVRIYAEAASDSLAQRLIETGVRWTRAAGRRT
jgi:phosphomannomutase